MKYCKKCNEKLILNDEYDSYYCPICNEWLSKKCSDENCEYCKDRPNKPIERKEVSNIMNDIPMSENRYEAEILMNAIYKEEHKDKIKSVRNEFANLVAYILDNCKDSREKSLALTKIEEACMWTIKGITRE